MGQQQPKVMKEQLQQGSDREAFLSKFEFRGTLTFNLPSQCGNPSSEGSSHFSCAPFSKSGHREKEKKKKHNEHTTVPKLYKSQLKINKLVQHTGIQLEDQYHPIITQSTLKLT